MESPQSVKSRIVKKITAEGRGWTFSAKDFAHFGSRSAIDLALHRLLAKETIRRVMRGVYDYPGTSGLLNQVHSPDIDQVAHALARKFGWRIQVTGSAALNLLGLSTQVPATYTYLSDGPSRKYEVNDIALAFKHNALKEMAFDMSESALMVQAIKSLGADRVSAKVIIKIRNWLPARIRSRVVRDTQISTGWVHEVIREICEGES